MTEALPENTAKQPAAADQATPKSPAGQPAVAQQGKPAKPVAEPESAAAKPAADSVIAAQEDGQVLASEMVGAKVVTPQGEVLGKIDDLIVDREGKVEGAVLSVGGFLGIGDKRVAVPWQALEQGGPDQPPVVAMTKDQLETAPEFMTLADQQAERQAALAPASPAVPAPASGGGSQ